MTESEPPRQIGADGVSPEALARFLYGESAADEAESVRAWLEGHPEQARSVNALAAGTGDLARTAPAVDVERALASVHARMRLDERRRPRRVYWWPTTAVLAAAAAIALLVIVPRWMHRGADDAYHMLHSNAVAQMYRTAPGTRREIRLSDGTAALLGPNSELRVLVGYGHVRRDVELRGSAAFDVRHDAGTPFVVMDGDARIQDVGTRFFVKTGSDSAIIVAVTQGSVRLADTTRRSSGLQLAAGQRAALTRATGAVRIPGSIAPADTAWVSGGLIFENASMDEVARGLADSYGVHLAIGDSSLAGRHFTGSFSATDPLDRVLLTLRLALGANVERHGDTVRVSPGSSP